MPADDRRGPDEHHVPVPRVPEPPGQHPEDLVAAAEAGPPAGRAGQDGQLLAEDQILGDQVGAVTERGLEQAEHEG